MQQNFWVNSYPAGMPATVKTDTYSSLVALLDEAAKSFGHKTAVSNFGAKLSYFELFTLSGYFAAWLQQAGFKKGDRVMIMLPNVLQYYVVAMGILRAGLVIVNINPLYTADELRHHLEDSGATAIVVLTNFAHTVESVLLTTPLKYVITTEIGDLLGFPKSFLFNVTSKYIRHDVPDWKIPNAVFLKDILATGKQLPLEKIHLTQNDIAFLQYTGGTTGLPKGAILTHGNMLANVEQATTWVKACGLKDGEEVIVSPLPLFHIFSLTTTVFCFLKLGGTVVLVTNPRDIPEFIKLLSRTSYTVLIGINTLFDALMQHCEFHDLFFKQVKLVVAGGMPLQKTVAKRWEEITGISILEGYGLTEASPIVAINAPHTKGFTGSIGLPLPSTEVSLRDANNREVPIGESGELCVKGPQVMQGYWHNESETAQAFTEDGWLKTGDIAKFDASGFLYIVDRQKDMISVSGFKVYPNEVENVIALHPKVKEVAVVGIPSKTSGEAVCAFIVRKSLCLKEEEITAFCAEYLTRYKIPRSIIFIDALPKSNVGKVLRRTLRDQAIPA